MAYGNPSTETMDEGMAPANPSPEPPDQSGEQPSQETSLFLTKDMLPPGMKLNAGDILEFKVVNPADPDGHIEVVYNTGDAGKEDSYEEGFKKFMSARTDGSGMKEDDGTGNSGAAY